MTLSACQQADRWITLIMKSTKWPMVTLEELQISIYKVEEFVEKGNYCT